jgi:hypothetical protein
MRCRPPATVRPAAAMRSTHREMRCSAAVQAATYRAARPAAALRAAHHRVRRAATMRAAAVKCRASAVDSGYAMERRCASERGLAMGGGRAERRFTVRGSGKSVARSHRTETPRSAEGSLAPGSAKVRRRLPPRAGACRGR